MWALLVASQFVHGDDSLLPSFELQNTHKTRLIIEAPIGVYVKITKSKHRRT